MVKRIRGTACSIRVSPAIANRIVESAKGVLLKFLPDIYIHTDHCKGASSGKSPGTNLLLANSTFFTRVNNLKYSKYVRFWIKLVGRNHQWSLFWWGSTFAS